MEQEEPYEMLATAIFSDPLQTSEAYAEGADLEFPDLSS